MINQLCTKLQMMLFKWENNVCLCSSFISHFFRVGDFSGSSNSLLMFMNCCFCGSPQHNLISKGQGQLQGLDFYQGMKHLYRVCLYSMILHTMQVGFLNYNKPYGRDMYSCLNGLFVAACWAALLC